jgi:hypothetical protein
MTTIANAVPRGDEIECDHDLHAFLCGLETDSSPFLPAQLRERLIALDDLDAGVGGCGSEEFTPTADSRIHRRAKVLRTQLEAANAELYQSVRTDIVRDVLSRLRMGSAHRSISVCSFGPCTRTVADEPWLKASAPPDTKRITVFDPL